MTDQEFNDLVEYRINQIRHVLQAKALEYAHGDRLSNFKSPTGLLRQSAKQVLLGYLMKHLVSLVDMIRTDAEGRSHTQMLWEEKIGDAINYLILLEGLVRE